MLMCPRSSTSRTKTDFEDRLFDQCLTSMVKLKNNNLEKGNDMLDKQDLKAIEKIVGGSENRLGGEIKKVETSLHGEINEVKTSLQNEIKKTKTSLQNEIKESEISLRGEINSVEGRLRGEIKDTENRIVSILSREITDLAEINHAIIEKVDKISELEKRIMRIEHKVGITA